MTPPRLTGRRLPLLVGSLTALAACGPLPATQGPDPKVAEAEAAARSAIASERSINPAQFPAQSVAVPPLSIASRDTTLAALGYGLADLLATDLAVSSRLSVVERIRLDAVLRELQLASSGAVDSTTASRVGRIAGARRLIVGAVTDLPGGELALNARIGDVVTGSIERALSARAPLDRILEAESQLALEIFSALGVALTPAERAKIEARPTRNIAALLAYSRGVRDESFGRYGEAAQQYQAALQADPGFANARARLSGVGVTTASANTTTQTRRSGSASTTTSTSRATELAVASVNPSLADIAAGGSTAAVAVTSAASSASSVQRTLFATVVIFIQPVP